ncbi:hypothetical protein SS50377_20945 [Spironucleus salmonicida]|uniref:Uncharacterized protein n=1 Tax=Spironucleus salmonicida TaxID=348837 RepID=V6LH32_9EUKA|nr:hypothetical protein SS50377_20945 [Spironucleus salmonicida]|eukprot:EST43618.1 Hypothetical protein SS50377_16660 [Spironucleus salmonicida]
MSKQLDCPQCFTETAQQSYLSQQLISEHQTNDFMKQSILSLQNISYKIQNSKQIDLIPPTDNDTFVIEQLATKELLNKLENYFQKEKFLTKLLGQNNQQQLNPVIDFYSETKKVEDYLLLLQAKEQQQTSDLMASLEKSIQVYKMNLADVSRSYADIEELQANLKQLSIDVEEEKRNNHQAIEYRTEQYLKIEQINLQIQQENQKFERNQEIQSKLKTENLQKKKYLLSLRSQVKQKMSTVGMM